jgi:pimeloyl-ACP methyl ester carboxylesterase
MLLAHTLIKPRQPLDACLTLVCLHGMGESRLMFSRPPLHLLPDHVQILSLDRPGYGDNGDLASVHGYSYAAFAALALNTIDHVLGSTATFACLGHSSGGPCALALAVHAGGARCRKLVLCAADPEYMSDPGLADPLGASLSLPPPTASAAQLGLVSQTELDADAAGLYNSTLRAAMLHSAGLNGPWADFVLERRAWGIDMSGGLPCPASLVYGDGDLFFGPANANWWRQRIPGLQVCERAGHGHFDIVLGADAWVFNVGLCL